MLHVPLKPRLCVSELPAMHTCSVIIKGSKMLLTGTCVIPENGTDEHTRKDVPQSSGAVVEPHPSPYPFMLTSTVLLSFVAAHRSSIATTLWVPQVETFLTVLTSMQLQHEDEFIMYFS